MTKDYYQILEVEKSASESEIKKSYRKLSKKHHPDVGGNEDNFKEIAEAYETLSDTEKKSNYDRYGHAGKNMSNGNPFGGNPFDNGFNMNDFTNNFNGGQRQKRGSDISFNIKITLEEVFNGVSKKFKYNRTSACKSCNGEGGSDKQICGTCNGRGFNVVQQMTPMGNFQSQQTCSHCQGEGRVVKNVCKTCNGAGVSYKEETVNVELPRGISENERLQYAGMGNAVKGGIPGSLIIKISILKHNYFEINGNDLKYNLKLSYPQLILGDKVKVPTIDGGKIMVDIPKYSNPGDNLRINKKGLYKLNTDIRGNMIIVLDIEIPKNIEDEELELIKKLKKIKDKGGNSEI